MNLLYRLQHLPRDARDTLFLLGVIGWIVLLLVAQLPAWCSAMAGLLLLWRGWIAAKGLALPSRWWLLLLVLVALAATLATHRTIVGQEAGVTFVVLLLALKTLEMRARRDTFVVFFLGFFALLASFFNSQSLATAAGMLVGLLGLLTALVNHHMPVGRPPLLQAARAAAGMALLGAPIMVVLFVLFPRVAPLWSMPNDAPTAGRSGLSGTMQVGTIASLALDDSVAMRIRFEGAPPPQRELYFRGPVLTLFDGREWTPQRPNATAAAQPTVDLQVNGPATRYEVTLEGSMRPWLPLLDATPKAPEVPGYRVRMRTDLQWTTNRPLSGLVRFQAESYTAFRFGPRAAQAELADALDIPEGSNPRTQQLAARLLQDPRLAKGDATQLVDEVLNRLRTGGYTYTLEPGLYGTHTADEFWFDRKSGFCEHIASSFVLLMRAMSVPARVVTGYQGGEANAFDGMWTVRQRDAHAWAEVWLEGQGWVRVDPTSAVAPARTGTQERLAAPRNAIAQALGTISPRFEINLRDLWDATNNRWNQWVLNYTQTRQFDMLRNLGFAAPGWEDLSYVLIGLIVGASLLGAVWAQWQQRHQDPWLRLLHAANHRMRKAGWPCSPKASPRQLAALLQAPSDASSEDTTSDLARTRDWLLRLEAWRYAAPTAQARKPRAALGTLRKEFRQLHWPSPHLP